MESELFGHERGAFTGAQTLRRGRFEQAEGGTLFLDEIGDMPAEMQTRLLRVLSEGHFYRVGGNQPVQSRVRVIAATHQDLEARVAQGLFRDDLFHRLNVIRLRLPPLAERVEDIPLLAAHFLAESAASLGVEPKRLGADALRVLCAFGWPGNVRQLENVCQWLTVMTAAHVVTMADLPPEMLPSRGAAATARPVTEAASVAAPQASGIQKIITEASKLPIFWQFVGVGGSGYGILEKLDSMKGRYVDNAGFFALDDFKKVSNEELYARLLEEFPKWLKAIRNKGMI